MAVTAKKKVVEIIPIRAVEQTNGETVSQKKRVCAYCRVSTNNEEQLESYENQVSYYTNHIQNKSEWSFVDIYADEGISGTGTKNRIEFQRMIKDAKEGKIDLILTKSISRFARNTMDLLKYVRELKEIGIAVLFEKENINTLESAGEVFLTIFSSIAQDESRNISENSRWGIVKGFKDGKVFCNTTRFLGYDKDENGELIINEKEAEIVRRIYREYLEGKSYQKIADGLERDGIPTITGNKKWWDSTVTGILANEKYCGTLLQQKTITVDYLSHKRVKNKGLDAQYRIEDNHEAIIPKEIFEKVQDERERRALTVGNLAGDRNKYSSKYPFSGKLICGDCGSVFRRRTWNSNNSSKKIVWQCKTYLQKGKKACTAKSIGEKVLEEAFVDVFNRLKNNSEGFIETLTKNIEKVLAKRAENTDLIEIESKIETSKEELKGLIKLQTKGQMDEEVYNEEYVRLSGELEKLRLEKEKVEQGNLSIEQYEERVAEIIKAIREQEGLLLKFDSKIFNALVEKIEILEPTHFVFVLRNGMRVEERL
ncbi:recombinase family protein [Clostridium pasteurianum]|uniref:recombinase family protein n=1 Tax=Clostridium pasteurianum TaxID=1501 RepID=UPI002260D6DA|nr:recombinase family protein [Clostridium pasteurianum]UZW12550.1 recombinase family protein [Clostridium pasteurianum]